MGPDPCVVSRAGFSRQCASGIPAVKSRYAL
jgi:hypothetical protein